MSDREAHGMNCAYRSDSDEPCTCACRYHAAVDTERTMHAAWRKRAEEAERENADLRARLDAAEQDRDVAWADIAVLRVNVMQEKKARDEQAEAVRVLGAALAACNELRQKASTMTYTTYATKVSAFGPLWYAVTNNHTAAAAVKEASK